MVYTRLTPIYHGNFYFIAIMLMYIAICHPKSSVVPMPYGYELFVKGSRSR
jgi:hypothetical protein